MSAMIRRNEIYLDSKYKDGTVTLDITYNGGQVYKELSRSESLQIVQHLINQFGIKLEEVYADISEESALILIRDLINKFSIPLDRINYND